MELGSWEGRFIAGMSEAYPNANFVGFGTNGCYLLCSTKIFEGERNNAKVSLFPDIAGIEEIVAPGEVDRFYINFVILGLRLNMQNAAYISHIPRSLYPPLKDGGEVHFKTDNEGLFMFSLEEFKVYKSLKM